MFVSSMRRAIAMLIGLSSGTALICLSSGCGPKLQPISELTNLRILGVKKSAPYARPGETVDLQMIWDDGRPESPPLVQTFFAFWCLNPAGDLYSECLINPPNTPLQYVFDEDEFEIQIPDDSVEEDFRDPDVPAYGTAFVFYGICAGELSLPINMSTDVADSASGEALLPRCLDNDGEELGPDDFIIGYSTIFIFEDLRNANPVMLGFEVNDEEVQVDCIDEDCSGQLPVPDLDDCQEGLPCFETCDGDGNLMTCPGTPISALLDPTSAQPDELAKIAYDQDIEESVWVNYFTDRGSVSASVTLANDADLGWQEDYGTSFFAPRDPGPVRIWATVRDNRGGFSWLRLVGYVKEAP